MRVAESACRLFDSQLQNVSLWPEELFEWAAVIMDDVKEKGDEYMTCIGDLWKDHYRQLRAVDKSVPQEELQLTVEQAAGTFCHTHHGVPTVLISYDGSFLVCVSVQHLQNS